MSIRRMSDHSPDKPVYSTSIQHTTEYIEALKNKIDQQQKRIDHLEYIQQKMRDEIKAYKPLIKAFLYTLQNHQMVEDYEMITAQAMFHDSRPYKER